MFKYIIIGDVNVGKSSLLIRFTDKKFVESYRPTIGVDFGCQIIKVEDDIAVRIQVWDTAGQENFRSFTKGFYRGACAAFLVYDVTRRESYDHISRWLREARTNCSKSMIMVLLGNKSDVKDSDREISYEEGAEFAKNEGMIFMETSAKSSENVDVVFYQTSQDICNLIKSGKIDIKDENSGIKFGKLQPGNRLNSSSCC